MGNDNSLEKNNHDGKDAMINKNYDDNELDE
jgi:hypothetical protein